MRRTGAIITLVFGTLLLTAGTVGHDIHRQITGAVFLLLVWLDDGVDRIVDAIRARADR